MRLFGDVDRHVSSGGGVNLKVKRFRAVDGVWVVQTVIRKTIMPVPNEGTIWEDISVKFFPTREVIFYL